MNPSIISLDAISSIVLIVVIFGCYVENFGKNRRTNVFMLLCVVGLAGSISDMLPFILAKSSNSVLLMLASQTITLVCAIWFALSFVYYLVETIRFTGTEVPEWIARVSNIVGTFTVIACIILCAAGRVYRITEGEIVRTHYYHLIIAVVLGICLYAGVIITYYKSKLGLHDALALYFYVLAPVICATFEIANEQLSITFTGIAMATLVLYVFIQTGEIRTTRMNAQSASLVAKEKSDFIARFSHELRTPINAIIGMDEIILRTTKEEETLSCARDIKSAGNTLLSIINDILDSARIESGKVEVIEVSYELVNMFNDLFNLIHSRAQAKNLEFIMDIDPNIPSKMFGDEVKIKQIITNILTNAVKYTTEGKVTLKVSTEKKSENTVALKVSVTDTGMGIKEEDIEKLFSPFSRIDELRNRYVEGTGLGMFITQSFLKMMDSQLEVSSVYGQGSTFAFEVIQAVENWTPMGEYDKAIQKLHGKRYVYSASFVAPDAHLLIVDDNNVNITVCKRLLKDTLVNCDSATSGFKAIEMCREKKYDLIFMDQMMPEMDGVETKDRIKSDEDSLNRDTPVVALTANAGAGSREALLELGFDDYLSKPIEYKQMETVVSELLPMELLDMRSLDNLL